MQFFDSCSCCCLSSFFFLLSFFFSGLGMEYGLQVSELSMQYDASVNAVLTAITNSNKLTRIHQTNAMLLRNNGARTWAPAAWVAKEGAATSMSTEDVLRSLSFSVWYGWSYDKWSLRSRWTMINNWISRLIALHEECVLDPLLFQVEIDVKTIVAETISNLTTFGATGDAALSTFMNTTLSKMTQMTKQKE